MTSWWKREVCKIMSQPESEWLPYSITLPDPIQMARLYRAKGVTRKGLCKYCGSYEHEFGDGTTELCNDPQCRQLDNGTMSFCVKCHWGYYAGDRDTSDDNECCNMCKSHPDKAYTARMFLKMIMPITRRPWQANYADQVMKNSTNSTN